MMFSGLLCVFFVTLALSQTLETANFITQVNFQLPWQSAKRYCIDTYGTHLAIIRSSEEQAEIAIIFTQNNNTRWIGYSDVQTEGKWLWVDGTNGSFTNWADNAPNNSISGSETQNCAVIYSQFSNMHCIRHYT